MYTGSTKWIYRRINWCVAPASLSSCWIKHLCFKYCISTERLHDIHRITVLYIYTLGFIIDVLNGYYRTVWPWNVIWYQISKHMHIRSIRFMDFCNVRQWITKNPKQIKWNFTKNDKKYTTLFLFTVFKEIWVYLTLNWQSNDATIRKTNELI